jgi:hypothetical protein
MASIYTGEWGRVAGKFGEKMFRVNDYFLHLCVTGISWLLVQCVRLCNSALRTQLFTMAQGSKLIT